MLHNSFTPSSIAAQPDEFFGRRDELGTLERSLMQGSAVVDGPIGIGKSSLVARARLLLEGFNGEHKARTILATAHKGIANVDDAARMILERFVDIDEKQKSVAFKLGKWYERKQRRFVAILHRDDISRFFRKS